MVDQSTVAAFEQAAEQSVAEPDLQNAATIIASMAEAEAKVLAIQTVLDKATKEYNRYKTRLVPEAMARAGVAEFKLADGEYEGVKAEIENFVSGSLPKDGVARAKAISWLESNGHAEVVRDVLTIPIAKEKQNDVHRLMDELKAQGYTVERKSDVHAQTLQALARERLRKGLEVAAETLGLYVGRVANIKWPKER